MSSGLTTETVAVQLAGLATLFGRRIGPERMAAYHRVLERRMTDEEFIGACSWLAENGEAKIPTPQELLKLGKQSLRDRHEKGTPVLRLGDDFDIPLAEVFSTMEQGKTLYLGDHDGFASRIERLEYEDAASQLEREPGEHPVAYARRIALLADAGMSRIRAAAAAQEAEAASQQAALEDAREGGRTDAPGKAPRG